jgi:formylglycine-generating enzyme required for sulfatase activity
VAKAPTCLPNGTCSTVGPSDVVPSGTDVTPPGDCKVRICDGAGKGTLVTDDTDQPPGDRCAPNTVCRNGALVPTPKLRGAICNGGAGRCDGLSACVGARSCASMAAGPVSRGSEMCAVARVNGGAFVLNKTTTVDPTALQAPHVVGDFWVDRYEVTVGRFRRFIGEFDAWRNAGNPASMGGYDSKLRPYEGDDPCIGWDQHDYVPACAASLKARVSTETLTWTADPEFTSQGFPLDERPMIGGLPWALARAFCLWDGGRLPTYAEHFYLKAQGSEQRDAPWLGPPSAMTDATATDASWSDELGTNPVLDINGNVTRYDLPCLVGGYCASGPTNDVIVNRSSDTFGAARFRDTSLGVSASAVYDLVGSATEWMLDASVPYATDGSPCVDCVRARPWSVTGGRATLGYHWRTGFSTTVAASVKRQGDGLCAKGTQTMGFRCVYTDCGDEAPLAPAACVTGHANAAPLGAADCDGASGAGGGYTSLCP